MHFGQTKIFYSSGIKLLLTGENFLSLKPSAAFRGHFHPVKFWFQCYILHETFLFSTGPSSWLLLLNSWGDLGDIVNCFESSSFHW